MPKALNVFPSERIDLTDFELGTRTYADEKVQLEAERTLLDQRSHVLDGFRISLSSSPGQFTVYNGNALNRDGARLTNEDQENASRTATLGAASTTYYVEIQFNSTASDTDARAFWDPSFNNGTSLPYKGKEFAENVSTRISSDWTIVSPISTSGFDITSNPNSNKIPLAVLVTNGSGLIVSGSNPGMSTAPASSVMDEDAAATTQKVRVRDARFISSTSSVIVGFGLGTAETKAVSSIDRRNGIITLAAPLVNDHGVGEVVRSTSTEQFIVENPIPHNVVVLPSVHPDKQRRFFQGDEYRGSGLFPSKTGTGRDDLNLRSEKDYIDFLSAQIREMRWGAPKVGVNSALPPTSFTANARYFDSSGGIAGSRTASITIGDGINSWGDLNGTTDAVFTSAVTALPPTGGIIFVKKGTYVLANAVTINKPIQLICEGLGLVTINKGNTSAGFIVNPGVNQVAAISDLTLGLDAAATTDLVLSVTGGTLLIRTSNILSKTSLGSCLIKAENTSFFNTSSLGPSPQVALEVATGATLGSSVFSNCNISTDVFTANSVGLRCIGTLSNVAFDNTSIVGYSAIGFGAGNHASVRFSDCTLQGWAQVVSSSGKLTNSSITNTSVNAILATNSLPSVMFTNLQGVQLLGLAFSAGVSSASPASPHSLLQMVGTLAAVTVEACYFSNASSYAQGVDLSVADCSGHVTISNCSFIGLVNGISSTGLQARSQLNIAGNLFDGNSGVDTKNAVTLVSAGNSSISITNNNVTRLTGTTLLVAAIYVKCTGSNNMITCSANRLDTLAAAPSLSCSGIVIDGDVFNHKALIADNILYSLVGPAYVIGINCLGGNSGNHHIVVNNFIDTLTSSSGSTTGLFITRTNSSQICHNSLIALSGTSLYGMDLATISSTDISNNKSNCMLRITAGGNSNKFEGNILELVSNTVYGIQFQAISSMSGLSILNNTIRCPADLLTGIRVEGSTSSVSIDSVNIQGNNIIGMSGTSLSNYGILVQQRSVGLVIKGNTISEGAFTFSNFGIALVTTVTGPAFLGVNISDNTLVGDAAASGARTTGLGILVSSSQTITISNNSCLWNRGVVTGSAEISVIAFTVNASGGVSITGNSVYTPESGSKAIVVAPFIKGVMVAGNCTSAQLGGSKTGTDILVNATTYASDHSLVGNIGPSNLGAFGYNYTHT